MNCAHYDQTYTPAASTYQPDAVAIWRCDDCHKEWEVSPYCPAGCLDGMVPSPTTSGVSIGLARIRGLSVWETCTICDGMRSGIRWGSKLEDLRRAGHATRTGHAWHGRRVINGGLVEVVTYCC